MKHRFFLTSMVVLMCTVPVISGHGRMKHQRHIHNQIQSVRKVPKILNQQRQGEGWTLTDFYWLTWAGIDYIDDLWDINTFPVAKIDPDYAIFKNSFDGWLFKSWDGWSKSIVTGDNYRFSCSHDTKGRITEYLVENDCQVTFTYNANANIHEMVWYTMEDTSSRWDDMEKMTYTYNANNQVEEIHSAWGDPVTGEIWGESKDTYSFNAQGDVIEEIGSWLDEGTNTYLPEYKDSYTYNTGNHLIEHYYCEWDEESGAWDEMELWSSYVYDQNGFLKLKFSSQEDSIAYTHDVNGNLNETTFYFWDDVSETWEAESRETEIYSSNGNLSTYSTFGWNSDSNAWIPNYMGSTVYTADDNLSEILELNWNSDLNVFDSSEKYVCTYDKDKNPEKYIVYAYEGTTGEWEVDAEYTIAFEYGNGIKQTTTTGMKNGINCTVKSGKRSLMVSVSGRPSGKDMLTVYDLQGRAMMQIKPKEFQGNTVYALDYNESNHTKLAKKVYILTVQKGRILFTHRLINIE